MNITENNKLITEFLGWHSRKFEEDELDFHTDWNWLMPVIEKILDISLNLDTMEMYYNITDSIPKIEQTHKEVVEFIKWYNNENN